MTGLTIAASCGIVALVIESIVKGSTVGAFGYSVSSSISKWLAYLSPAPLAIATAGLSYCFYSCVSTYRFTHTPQPIRQFQGLGFNEFMSALERKKDIVTNAIKINNFTLVHNTINQAIQDASRPIRPLHPRPSIPAPDERTPLLTLDP